MKSKEKAVCPHCGIEMKKWKVPDDSTWEQEFHWVCFNDECEYYVRGWSWMESQYQQKASYRCRINPADGKAGPLPVWSPDAHKDYIVEGPDEDE